MYDILGKNLSCSKVIRKVSPCLLKCCLVSYLLFKVLQQNMLTE